MRADHCHKAPVEASPLPESRREILNTRPARGPRKRRYKPPLTTVELRTALEACASNIWPAEKLLALCVGWRAGEKTAALATRLGITNNAVIGAVHRLVARGILEARPSPVIRDADDPRRATNPTPRRKVSLPAVTLPPLASADESPVASLPSPPRLMPTPPLPPRPYGRITECCWPIGEPGTRAFRFCDAPTEPGRPYCEEHARTAFVRVRDRREDYARPGP
jgi:GcrA cell cycle regulator